MSEIETKNLEVYAAKFEEDPTTFDDFQAMDYVKLLKNSGNNEEAIEVGKTFLSLCPNLRRYKNQYGYALYNKFINIDDEAIKANEDLFYSILEDILAVCKQEPYSPYEATINRAIKYILHNTPIAYDKIIEVLDKLDVSLLSEKPFTNDQGKEFESKKERYYRLKVRAYFETNRHKECVECANNALALPIKWHYNALQWIKYYRGSCLVELKQYEEAEREFLSLQNRIRGINFYEVLYRTYSQLDQDKQANAYLLYEFFQNGFSVEQVPMYNRVLEACQKTNKAELIDAVDAFITVLAKENNLEHTPLADYSENDAYKEKTASDLYDKMYDIIMQNLGILVERKEGTVVHFNQDRQLGTISIYDEDGIFFRQADYVYDEDVRRRDKVEYTTMPTYDVKKDRITTKAILIITTDEYVDYGY